MAYLNYYENGEWLPVGADPRAGIYVPATGGTVEGPFPLAVDTGNVLDDDIVVNGMTFAAGLTTIMHGSLDMDIALRPGRTATFGGAELFDGRSSDNPDGAITLAKVLSKVKDIETWPLVFDQDNWTQDGEVRPIAKKNRESLVLLQGMVQPVSLVAAGTLNHVVTILPTGWRPAFTIAFSTLCSTAMAVPCRVNIYPDGRVTYGEGPLLPRGNELSLEGISFYAV